MKTKDFSQSTSLSHFPSACSDKYESGVGICSGQIWLYQDRDTRPSMKEHKKVLRSPFGTTSIPATIILSLPLRRHLSSQSLKSCSHPKPTWLLTECLTTWQLYPSLQTDRGELLWIT